MYTACTLRGRRALSPRAPKRSDLGIVRFHSFLSSHLVTEVTIYALHPTYHSFTRCSAGCSGLGVGLNGYPP